MATHRFLPFAAVTTGIRLQVVPEPNCTDADYPSIFGTESTVEAFRVKDSMPLVPVQFEVTLPANLAQRVLTPLEAGNPPLRVILDLRSASSRVRRKVDISSAYGPLAFTYVETFNPEEWTGTVTASVAVFRTSASSPPVAPYASKPFAVVGRSDPVSIYFDDPTHGASGDLDIRWEDFSQTTSAWRKRHPDHLFDLDLESEGRPVLFLNEGLDSAHEYLMHRGANGLKNRTKIAAFDLMTHQTWTSILSVLLFEAASLSESERAGFQGLEEWKRGILRLWAPRIYPGMAPDDALKQLEEAADFDQPQLFYRVMGRIATAIQSADPSTVLVFKGLALAVNRMRSGAAGGATDV